MPIQSRVRIAAVFTLLSSAALFSGATSASAATVVSNLSESANVANNLIYLDPEGPSYTQGQTFTTGALASTLNSVTLDLAMASPGQFAVQLRTPYQGIPNAYWTNTLVTLTPSASFTNGLNTFNGTYALSANTTYYIVVVPLSAISLSWAATSSTADTSNEGWTIGNTHGQHFTDSGVDVFSSNAPNVGRMSIDATVVPEPTSAALLSCGAALGLRRLRKRRA